MNRHIARDSYTTIQPDFILNPVSVLIVPKEQTQQAVGVDARYEPGSAASLYGRYDYDLNSRHSLRGELLARMQATEAVAFTGEFVYREPFVPFNSFFTVFPLSPIREAEGGIRASRDRRAGRRGRRRRRPGGPPPTPVHR